MPSRTLSNPAVVVNDTVVSIIPNSLSYKVGTGDRKIKSQSAGGSSIDMIVTEDAESKVSMVKFKMYTTSINLGYVKTWSALITGVTIDITESGVSEAFTEMVVVTEPEIAIGADGELELEFQGRPH